MAATIEHNLANNLDKMNISVSGEGNTPSGNLAETPEASPSEKKNNSKMSIFKRLSSKSKKKNATNGADNMLDYVKVESLPQTFVTKFMGSKPSPGLAGVKAVRGPIDALFADLKNADEGHDLPLMNFTVEAQGIHVDVHKASRSTEGVCEEPMFHPIEYISYAVQDVFNPRIFSFIIVKEMSAKQHRAECHVHLCETAIAARKLAMSLSLAFAECAKMMAEGKSYRFQVDLRNSEEQTAENDQVVVDEEEEEC